MRHLTLAVTALLIAGCAAPNQQGSGNPDPAPNNTGTPKQPDKPAPPPRTYSRGGASFASAAKVTPGADGSARWWAPAGAPQFYAVSARDGYGLRVKAAGGTAEILDREQKSLATGEEAFWLSATGGPTDFVVKIAATEDAEVQLRVEDNTDGGMGRDAAGSFAQAMAVKASSFTGWLCGESEHRGTDMADAYSIEATQDKTVKIVVTSPAKLRLELTAYDRNQKKVAGLRAPGVGEPVGIEFTPSYTGAYVFGLDAEGPGGGSYKVEITRVQ
jgi:hypothetical protein